MALLLTLEWLQRSHQQQQRIKFTALKSSVGIFMDNLHSYKLWPKILATLKALLQKSNFTYFLKESKDRARQASSGKEFHNCGATTEKVLCGI